MSQKKQDSKILFLKNYRKKKASKKEKKVFQKASSDQNLSTVINLSSYLKTKGIDQEQQKNTDHQDQKTGRVISFSKYAPQLSPQKLNLTQKTNNVVFLEDYLKRKNLSSIFVEDMSNPYSQTSSQHINNEIEYKWMSRVAAAALMVLASAVFFQTNQADRQLASAKTMEYKNSSSELEYAEYIRNQKLVIPQDY